MRVGYVAKHDSGGADDEGALTHALTALGHNVQRLREDHVRNVHKLPPCDFLLFHHLRDLTHLRRVKAPKVCWCFDLIRSGDPTLAARDRVRSAWLANVKQIADLVFLTDGDAVASDTSGKLVWLTQGADERVVGRGKANGQTIPLLFTGIRNGGTLRMSFVEEMVATYGSNFYHVARGVYGRALADLIASSQIVLAPDGPATDRYWSCRVYHTLGYGVCLMHPYCAGLASHYECAGEILYYRSRQELHDLVRWYLQRPDERQKIAAAGLARTQAQHLYRHRLERLIGIVKEKLGL